MTQQKSELEKLKEHRKVYVIEDGYAYEGSSIITVFDTKEKAKKHLDNWKGKCIEEFGIENCEELPFGFKFVNHFRIAVEIILNSEGGN